MELAAIITTLVVILQIITLAIVFKTLKLVRELAKRKVPLAHNSNNNSYKNRRDRDFKSNKRLPQDNAPKPQIQKPAASTSADPVEKSLRDINLRLKNAERDQEFARKKIQENFSKDPNHRRDKNGNNNNNNNRRNDRRGKWQDKKPSESAFSSPAKSDFSKKPDPLAPITPEVESIPEITPQDFGTDDLQHGRKVTVKRRVLKDEESKPQNVGTSQSQIPENNSSAVAESVEDKAQLEASGEIKFGRR